MTRALILPAKGDYRNGFICGMGQGAHDQLSSKSQKQVFKMVMVCQQNAAEHLSSCKVANKAKQTGGR